MEQVGDLWNFFFDFGLLNWFLVLSGFAIYWLVLLQMEMSKCKKDRKMFSYRTFKEDHFIPFLVSVLCTFIGSPIIVNGAEVENQLYIITLGGSGGWAFRNAMQIVINRSAAPPKTDE